jgi:hypothetical protein
VKVYESLKIEGEDGWRHTRIQLSPNSYDNDFHPIELSGDDDQQYRVVGEFICLIDQ